MTTYSRPHRAAALLTAAMAAALAFGPSPASAQAQRIPAAAVKPIAKGQHIFIAGHSFNVFICAPLEALAAEAGLKGHTSLGVQMIGNSTPMQHWNQATDETNIAKVALRKGDVDVFTMSPNAQIPEEGIDKFADLAAETNPNVRLLVQASWSAWDGNPAPNFARPAGAAPRAPGAPGAPGATPRPIPAATPGPGCANGRLGGPPRPAAAPAAAPAATPPRPPIPTDPNAFKNALRDNATVADLAKGRENGKAYMDRFRGQLAAINERHHRQMAFVVPAAEAVARLREQVIAGKVPGVAKQSELFRDDMGHAGPVVSNLVTYVWFTTLYRKSPIGLTALDTEKTDASRAQHRLLQQIAWQTVLDEPMSGVTPASARVAGR